jgi:hypothetical protein
MNKQFAAVCLLLILLTGTAIAQTGWQWGKRGGGSGGVGWVSSVVDAQGNVYLLAQINYAWEPPDVDGYTDSSGRRAGISLSKWDCAGTHRWTRFINATNASITSGASINIKAYTFAIDSVGGLYFAGSFQIPNPAFFLPEYDTIFFPGGSGGMLTRPNASGGPQWYIAKYDTAGNFQWVKTPEADTVTVNKSAPFSLDAAPNGDFYLFALLAPGIYSGSYVNTANNSMQLMRYNKNGDFLDAVPMDISIGVDSSTGFPKTNLGGYGSFVRDHRSGRFYIASCWDSSITFGNTPVYSSYFQYYLTAFDSSGHNLWLEQNSTSGNFMYNRLPIDEQGNIYLAEEVAEGNTFFGDTAHNAYNEHPLTSIIYSTVLVLSITPFGHLRWAKHAINNSFLELQGLSYANGIVATAGGSVSERDFFSWGTDTIFGAPFFSPDILFPVQLSRFNAYTGSQVSKINTDMKISNGGGWVEGITAAKNGSIYLNGALKWKVFLPTVTLTNQSHGAHAHDFFVAKYGSADCNCTLAATNFSYAVQSGTNTVYFTYTGSTGVDSVRWEFGDGSMSSGISAIHTYDSAGTYGVSIAVYNSCGIVVDYKTVNTTVGVAEAEALASVKIYPNPAAERITIEGAGIGTQAVLYNAAGLRVLSAAITQDRQDLSLSGLSSGLYLLRFTTPTGQTGSVKIRKE